MGRELLEKIEKINPRWLNRFLVFCLLQALGLFTFSSALAQPAQNAFVVLSNRNGVLNVRAAPVTGQVIGHLHDARDVTVLEETDGWALVCYLGDYANPIGWVCVDYLHLYGAVFNITEEHVENEPS